MKRTLLLSFVLLQMTLIAQVHHRGLFDEFARNTDDPVFIVDSAHYFPSEQNSDSNFFTRTYFVTLKNEAGKMLQAEQYQFDEENQEWTNTHRYSASYHPNGSLNEYTKLLYLPDSAGWVVDEYQKNDEHDRVLVYTDYFRLSVPHANSGTRNNYEYNSFDSLSSYLLEFWNIGYPWRPLEKEEYTYNDTGYLSQKIFFDHDSVYNLYPDFKWEYYYENGINSKTYTYRYNKAEEIWELKYRFFYTYDENGNKIQSTYFKQDEDSVWYHYARRTFVYNNSNKVIAKFKTSFDTTLQQWIAKTNYYWDYFGDTLLKSLTCISFKADSGIWTNSYRYSNTYDENLNLTKILDERGEWTEWEMHQQYIFNFNQDNLLDKWKLYFINFVNDSNYWVRIIMENYFHAISTLIEENVKLNENYFITYPNPTSNYLKINFLQPNSGTRLRLYSADYKLVFHDFTDKQEMTIDLSKYKKGVYFLHSENRSKRQVRKIILQ